MAFIPYSYDCGQMPPAEYASLASAGDITVGLCMALGEDGAALSVKPDHICLREEKNAAANTLIPLMHIGEGIVFEAPLAADAAALVPGSVCDVAADGLSIAATSANGNIIIVSMDGNKAGDLCRCRFLG